MPIINIISDPSQAPEGAIVTDVSASYNTQNVYIYESHQGLCLEDRERNGYDDSDWYMTVWNAEKQEPESICYASTRGWTYPAYGSKVDATPEVRAAYDAYRKRLDDAAREAHEARMAAMPRKGLLLEVVKGRKVPVGAQGVCIWSDVQFKAPYGFFQGYEGRVGIRDAAGQVHFTAVTNVVILEGPLPEEVKPEVKCRRCGATDVAWIKSQRTGKNYMITTTVVDGEVIKNPRNFHNCEGAR